jgi:hypothetical protein
MPNHKPNAITDPLYVIFEQHLYNFQDPDVDRKTFIGKIIQDYLTHLRRMSISIPKSLEAPIVEELAEQVNSMLVKKIYGSFSLGEYQKKAPTKNKRQASSRYKTLAKKAG